MATPGYFTFLHFLCLSVSILCRPINANLVQTSKELPCTDSQVFEPLTKTCIDCTGCAEYEYMRKCAPDKRTCCPKQGTPKAKGNPKCRILDSWTDVEMELTLVPKRDSPTIKIGEALPISPREKKPTEETRKIESKKEHADEASNGERGNNFVPNSRSFVLEYFMWTVCLIIILVVIISILSCIDFLCGPWSFGLRGRGNCSTSRPKKSNGWRDLAL